MNTVVINMDNVSLFGDTFSSLEDEQILNIKRPSLISISSDDGNNENDYCNNDFSKTVVNAAHITFRENNLPCSTPYSNRRKNYDTCCADDSHLTGDIKRLSLSVFDSSVNNTYVLNKSASLHDLSLAVQNMAVPLHRDLITYSTETLQSNSAFTTKSKDSGFQRSTSCTSITTVNGSKKYDHVPSKVKQYIQSIKQREALNKMKKQQCSNNYNGEIMDSSPSSDSVPISKKDLLSKVRELEEEIKEKDDVIDQLAKDHTKLKLKYAAVENQIDDLRIKIDCMDKQPAIVNEDKLLQMLETKISFNDSYLNDSSVENMSYPGGEPHSLYTTNCNKVEEPAVCSQKCFLSSSPSFLPNNVSSSPSVLKSFSYKHVNSSKPAIKKSASNVDNVKNVTLPKQVKEESCFDKVERWQKSLQWTDDVVGKKLKNSQQPYRTKAVSYCDSSDSKIITSTSSPPVLVKKYASPKNKKDEFVANFDSDSGTCISKNDIKFVTTTTTTNSRKKNNDSGRSKGHVLLSSGGGRKLVRSVSLVSYNDSSASDENSLTEDDDDGAATVENSFSDSSSVFSAKHDSYRTFKLQQKKKVTMTKNVSPPKSSHRDVRRTVADSNFDIAKANSAGNISSVFARSKNQNKRASDLKSSCGSSCSQCNGSSETNNNNTNTTVCRSTKKYLKLDDEKRAKLNPIIKCKTVDFYNKKVVLAGGNSENGGGLLLHRTEGHAKKTNKSNDISTKYPSKSKQCRCLSVIDKLQSCGDHETVEKFVQHADDKCHPTKSNYSVGNNNNNNNNNKVIKGAKTTDMINLKRNTANNNRK